MTEGAYNDAFGVLLKSCFSLPLIEALAVTSSGFYYFDTYARVVEDERRIFWSSAYCISVISSTPHETATELFRKIKFIFVIEFFYF